MCLEITKATPKKIDKEENNIVSGNKYQQQFYGIIIIILTEDDAPYASLQLLYIIPDISLNVKLTIDHSELNE